MRKQALLAVGMLSLLAGIAHAQESGYRVNGSEVAPEMGMLLKHYGFQPGDYYIDANGNYGKSGEAPTGNVRGGPVVGWSGSEPKSVAGNPYAQAYIQGVTWVRIFWVYSPAIGSRVSGGGSGYYHVCPGSVLRYSSESGVSISTNTYSARNYAGTAGTDSGTGRWSIESGANGPNLVGYTQDGGSQSVPIALMMNGSWNSGRTKYTVEPGKAAC
ncbi:MAG: hypothetical protein AAGL10_10645 [Pseudomonadota bacterium]